MVWDKYQTALGVSHSWLVLVLITYHECIALSQNLPSETANYSTVCSKELSIRANYNSNSIKPTQGE